MQPAEFPDYSEITSIRQTGLILLQSDSTQEAQDMAVAAHALAIKSGKAVVHFFSASQTLEVPVEDATLLEQAYDLRAISRIQSTTSDSTNIYADDGAKATTQQIDFPTSNEPPSSGLTTPANEASLAAPVDTSSTGSSTVDDKSSRPSLSSARWFA